MRRVLPLLCALTVALAAIGRAPLHAHDIPADVTVRAFVRPEGARVDLLVRVPFGAFRDIAVPLRDATMLDVGTAADAARAGVDLWIANGVRLLADGRDLGRPRVAAVRLALPSDRAFESWATALAGFGAPPLPVDTQAPWAQVLVDTHLVFDGAAPGARLALETEFARLGLRTATVLQFLPADGTERVYQFFGDPGRVALDPRWHEAARWFVVSGIEHIVFGLDHLLFLVCLVLPFRQLRPLVIVVTAFTAAHSITVIAAACGYVPEGLWFPPLVETLIAASIVWMAFENIVGVSSVRRRWLLTVAFGLVHGFGFSFALRESLQFGGRHVVTSLAAFNIGVEVGQLAVLVVLVPAIGALCRVMPERIGAILVSAVVAHQAWHWLETRAADFWAHDLPSPSAATMTWGLRALIAAWVLAGLWLWRRRR